VSTFFLYVADLSEQISRIRCQEHLRSRCRSVTWQRRATWRRRVAHFGSPRGSAARWRPGGGGSARRRVPSVAGTRGVPEQLRPDPDLAAGDTGPEDGNWFVSLQLVLNSCAFLALLREFALQEIHSCLELVSSLPLQSSRNCGFQVSGGFKGPFTCMNFRHTLCETSECQFFTSLQTVSDTITNHLFAVHELQRD